MHAAPTAGRCSVYTFKCIDCNPSSLLCRRRLSWTFLLVALAADAATAAIIIRFYRTVGGACLVFSVCCILFLVTLTIFAVLPVQLSVIIHSARNKILPQPRGAQRQSAAWNVLYYYVANRLLASLYCIVLLLRLLLLLRSLSQHSKRSSCCVCCR